jgi:hypothetical protein
MLDPLSTCNVYGGLLASDRILILMSSAISTAIGSTIEVERKWPERLLSADSASEMLSGRLVTRVIAPAPADNAFKDYSTIEELLNASG